MQATLILSCTLLVSQTRPLTYLLNLYLSILNLDRQPILDTSMKVFCTFRGILSFLASYGHSEEICLAFKLFSVIFVLENVNIKFEFRISSFKLPYVLDNSLKKLVRLADERIGCACRLQVCATRLH